jgi:hypothetical protein
MDATVLKEIEREEAMKSPRKKQAEPTPAPSPKADTDATPPPQTASALAQSTLASKGFY